jgi:hypothetical protein
VPFAIPLPDVQGMPRRFGRRQRRSVVSLKAYWPGWPALPPPKTRLRGRAVTSSRVAGQRYHGTLTAAGNQRQGPCRGVGPATTLEVEPGPGLTLVVGRNGSGKSSFAEALELLLTGDSWRWRGR